MSEGLERALRAVVRDCLGVREGENALVICNPATQRIGARMREEAAAAGADAVLAIIDERASHAAEPPPTVANAMLRADVIIAPTVQSLSHTAARNAASDAGARVATLPGVTEEMLARAMSADIEGLRRKGTAVAEALEAATGATIGSADGAVLRLDLGGRPGIPDSGDIRERGAFGNLPCGEGFISPAGGEGVLVVDGSIASIGKVSEPARLTIEDGRLVVATGPEGERLYELLSVHGEDGTRIAELGIGTNEKAILTGEILEDEKILGTCHVAFGASAGIGGTIQVPVHLDCVVMRPTVTLDDHPIVSDGELLV
ncbi:MAG TPA: aminopeptidase [Candidatus Limnocylindria bacterium]|nr:aminopeptidase [Candidatus Limnocylindria bacterium]